MNNSFLKKIAGCGPDRKYARSVAVGLLFLAASLAVNYYAGMFATESASGPVKDLVLDHIPIQDVSLLFIYGPPVFWLFAALVTIAKPCRIPFVLKSVALFVCIRSLFITLTHIGPFPDALSLDYSSRFLKNFTFGGDLFFSGHTGAPFLIGLIYNRHPAIRAACFISAGIFGAVVLLGHLHYSIDVLAAFFITYTIYHISAAIFAGDKRIFDEGI